VSPSVRHVPILPARMITEPAPLAAATPLTCAIAREPTQGLPLRASGRTIRGLLNDLRWDSFSGHDTGGCALGAPRQVQFLGPPPWDEAWLLGSRSSIRARPVVVSQFANTQARRSAPRASRKPRPSTCTARCGPPDAEDPPTPHASRCSAARPNTGSPTPCAAPCGRSARPTPADANATFDPAVIQPTPSAGRLASSAPSLGVGTVLMIRSTSLAHADGARTVRIAAVERELGIPRDGRPADRCPVAGRSVHGASIAVHVQVYARPLR
jgi:hypothetical protein